MVDVTLAIMGCSVKRCAGDGKIVDRTALAASVVGLWTIGSLLSALNGRLIVGSHQGHWLGPRVVRVRADTWGAEPATRSSVSTARMPSQPSAHPQANHCSRFEDRDGQDQETLTRKQLRGLNGMRPDIARLFDGAPDLGNEGLEPRRGSDPKWRSLSMSQ